MKKFIFLSLVVSAVVLSGCALPWQKTAPVACTLEAQICPDGSAVGRTGPNCEFAACPAASSAQLANPASANCVQKGGKVVIKDGPAGQYGLCYFEDNRACEEWAMMRGDCPVGGMKTTGYDTEAQRYCAWSGGSTFAVANAVCNFNDGSYCLAEDFYNGTCQKGENFSSNTLGWQIYTNYEYGFQFKYPKDWPTPNLSSGLLSGGYPVKKSNWTLGFGPIIEDALCSGKDCFSYRLEGYSPIGYNVALAAIKNDEFIKNIKEININGQQAISFIEGGMADYPTVIIFGSNQMFKFTSMRGEENYFNQIIATFKFTK